MERRILCSRQNDVIKRQIKNQFLNFMKKLNKKNHFILFFKIQEFTQRETERLKFMEERAGSEEKKEKIIIKEKEKKEEASL